MHDPYPASSDCFEISIAKFALADAGKIEQDPLALFQTGHDTGLNENKGGLRILQSSLFLQ
jgi:hypothetical protein